MDLFDYMREKNLEKESPLASRLRPVTLDEVVGQQHIIGKGKLLYRAIVADKLSSVIFYGPPGTGKTTCKGDCKYNERAVYAAQCDLRRKKGYGGGHQTGEGQSGHVSKTDDSVYR